MIIGLTGSIASGKSTVSAMLAKRGFPIIDADAIARLVVEPGSSVLEEISQQFGAEIVNADGALDREKLGKRIFGSADERRKLNQIIHPAIRKEMLSQKERWQEQGAETIIMDIPLLFESKLQSYVDKILVVSVTPAIQKKRLMERNQLTEEEAEERIASQLPMDEKERGADAVLYNNGTLEETEEQLDHVLRQWKAVPFLNTFKN